MTPDHRQTLIRACVDAFRSKPSVLEKPLMMAVHQGSSVNVILVVGHEKLNVEMQRTYGNRITVVKIPKSGGVCAFAPHMFSVSHVTSGSQVVELDTQYRQRVHAQQLHTYFYGQVTAPPRGLSASAIGDADFDGRLAPSSSLVPFGELTFLRIGESE